MPICHELEGYPRPKHQSKPGPRPIWAWVLVWPVWDSSLVTCTGTACGTATGTGRVALVNNNLFCLTGLYYQSSLDDHSMNSKSSSFYLFIYCFWPLRLRLRTATAALPFQGCRNNREESQTRFLVCWCTTGQCTLSTFAECHVSWHMPQLLWG